MTTLYCLFLIYFLTPMVLAIAEDIAVKNGFMTIVPKRRLTSKIKTISAEDYFAASVILGLATLAIIVGYKIFGGYPPVWVGASVMALIVLPTFALAIITFRATQIYKLSPTAFNVAGGFLVALLTFIASIFADWHINYSIGITGSDLSAAQRAVTFMLALVFLGIALTFVASLLYFIAALVSMAHSTTTAKERRAQQHFFMMGGTGTQLQNTKSKEGIYLTLFIGLAYTTTIILQSVVEVSKEKRLERWANKLTVFASFHLDKHPCFPNSREDTKFALVDSERVAAAIPDPQLGYTYELRRCQTPAR